MDSTSTKRGEQEISVAGAEALAGLLQSVERVFGAAPGRAVDVSEFLALLDVDELVGVDYGAEFLTDIRANAVEDRMWTAKRLRAFYHKHWRQPWFEKRATFLRMLHLLVEQKGAFVQVGGYLRTIAMRRAARDPRVAKVYHVRSRIEGNHGLEKRHGEIRWAESKGLSKRNVQVTLVVLGEASLALTRLQHGFTHDLDRFVHLV
jgi:hypothetical protein